MNMEVQAHYPADLALFIDGAWRRGEGRETRQAINLATEGRLGKLPIATDQDLDRALESAQAGFERWRKVAAWERDAILRRSSRLIPERKAADQVLQPRASLTDHTFLDEVKS